MLYLAGIGMCAGSCLLNIVGLAIPYWIYSGKGLVTYNSGLWKYCIMDTCVSYEPADSAMKATRAMEILGMLIIIGAIVCAALKQFVLKQPPYGPYLPKIGGGTAIAAGSLMILGTIIFATSTAVKLMLESTEATLHAGFALCIISGVMAIAAGILMFIDKNV